MYKVPEVMYKAGRGPMKGTVSAQRALQRPETETRKLLVWIEEKSNSLSRGHDFLSIWPPLIFDCLLLTCSKRIIDAFQNPGWEHSRQRRDQRSLLGLQELCCWEGWARGRSQATRIRLHAWTDVLDQLGSGVVRKVDGRKTQVSGIISHMSQKLFGCFFR